MDILTKPNFTFEELNFIMVDALGFDLLFFNSDNSYFEYAKEDMHFMFCEINSSYWEMEFEFSSYNPQLGREIKIRSAEYRDIVIGDIFETLKFADGVV